MLKRIDIKSIEAIAKEAGDVIMEIYEKDFSVAYKQDNSPLTQADIKANEIICNALKNYYQISL